jgi:hypothetical protein
MEEAALAFLRAHTSELVRKSAELIKQSGIPPYVNLTLEQITDLIQRTVELDIGYVADGNLAVWREYHLEVINQLVKSGRDFGGLLQVGLTIGQVIKEFIQTRIADLPPADGVPTTRVVAKLLRRCNNLEAAAVSLTTTAGLQQTIHANNQAH